MGVGGPSLSRVGGTTPLATPRLETGLIEAGEGQNVAAPDFGRR